MSQQTQARLLFSLVLLVFTLVTARPARAACFYPHSHTTTYYAWIDNTDPSWYSCQQPNISPCCSYLHWGPIGERTVDCNGSVYLSGDTTTCTGSGNTQTTLGPCDPICE